MARRRFDQNTNRVDYSELLTMDPEYELDQAVGMTYTLDMEALMGIPLSLGMHGDMSAGERKNPLYVLEAIRRTGKKLSIFCNAGCIKVPAAESRLYALLEDSIHEVRMPNYKYNFHPKVWVLQFHKTVREGGRTQQKYKIKVVALSRNLTFDQSMDVAVEMSGDVGEEVNPKNQPLADLLRFVSQFDPVEKHYDALIRNLMHVSQFDLQDCFKDYAFHPFGIYGKSENGIQKIRAKEPVKTPRELFRDCHSLFVVSPFLSESVISDILYDFSGQEDQGPSYRCLITREASLTEKIYRAFYKNGGDGVYVVEPLLTSNDALENNDYYGNVHRDIHAKVYYTEKHGEPHRLWLGSLNASYNAYQNNVEFLLELSYKPNFMSYKSFMLDFIPEEQKPFRELIDFNPEDIKLEPEHVDFREEVYSLKGAEIKKEDNNYSITITVAKAFPDVTIRPFYVKTKTAPLQETVEFQEVPLDALSNMFILRKENAECLVRLEVTGMPIQEREDAILNEIVSNRPRFLTYMRYLLDEDFYDTVSYEDYLMQEGEPTEASTGYGFTTEPDIYERMLRVAAENPERFESMKEVSQHINADIVGPEFSQLLDLFIQAARQEAKGKK